MNSREVCLNIEYLDPEKAKFGRTEGGFLNLRIGRKKPCPRVNLYRSYPLSRPDELISVRDSKDVEIAIIASLHDFDHDTILLIEEELNRRYFTPSIQKLISLKEEFGYTYWDADTDSGFCRFTVKGGENNVILLSENMLLIIDVDGNRFEFPDFQKCDSKSTKIIDSML